MIDHLPGLVLLVVLAALVVFAVGKLSTADLKEVLLGSNVIVVSAALFGLLLVVQLLKEQSWMPDLLKVVAGVVAGAIAAKKGNQRGAGGDTNMNAIGEQILQAARDFNNIKTDFNKIENSLVTQIKGAAQDDKSIVLFHENERLKLIIEIISWCARSTKRFQMKTLVFLNSSQYEIVMAALGMTAGFRSFFRFPMRWRCWCKRSMKLRRPNGV